jgi:hypothetical protein
MHTTRSIFLRWFLLPTILVGLHTALIALTTISVAISSDTEAVMAWILPYYIDYPASQLIQTFDMTSESQQPIFYLILGVVYWGFVGILLQSAWKLYARWRQPNETTA